MMNTKILAGLTLGAALSTLATSALADPPTKKQGNYEYRFDDDKMLGQSMGATGQQITVLKLGARDRLLKPRVQFIAEMLKSVENM
jgi:hypothetical protein